MQSKTLQRLLGAVRGTEPADKIITNGRIVNVFTNKIEEGFAITVKDGYIAKVDRESRLGIAKETEVVDAQGMYLCPGFIDAHTHLDAVYPFYELVPFSLKGGTTCLVTEAGMVGTSCGKAALESFYESTKGYPLRCYFLAPPLTPPFPDLESAVGMTLPEFKDVLRRKDVLGIGEAYWTRVVEGDARVLAQASLALSLGKTLEGHAAGAKGSKLAQYVVTGITSDHESTTVEEAVEKLRLGLYVMIREGFVRKELGELSKLKDLDVDKSRIILVSDTFDAVMLYEEGYVDSIVRSAIEYGFPPMDAIKMATINPANYYGLPDLGAIAPLRHADIVFLEDLSAVSVRHVMVNGEMEVVDGDFKGVARPYVYPESMRQTIKAEKVTADDFRIAAPPGKERVRVIQLVSPTITRETEAVLNLRDGRLEPDAGRDIIPVAVINRKSGKEIGKGFITGTGITEGAFATTLTWDTGNILTLGSSEADMAAAVNRLIELQGGIVISRRGEVIYEFAMPVYGLVAELEMREITQKTKELDNRMGEIGASISRPFLTLQTIPFTGLPFLRITDKGLADIKNRQLVPLYL
jgi:adenine deaminase